MLRVKIGGNPPGEILFYRQTGLTKYVLRDAGVRSYGDLCELAGFQRRRLTERMTRDELFRPLALLAAKLKRFPDSTDREIAHREDATFPGYRAYRTAQDADGPLDLQLLEWCGSQPEHSEAAVILQSHVSQKADRPQRIQPVKRKITGYVYLMRYGKSGRDYKLGMTDEVSRRHAQISGMYPGDLRIVHVIGTDDPNGIERYWKRRFESRQVQGKDEIFRLLPEDLVAFKSRKYQ